MPDKKKDNEIKDDRPKNYDEDLRRLEISQLRILAQKHPREFKKIADQINLKAA